MKATVVALQQEGFRFTTVDIRQQPQRAAQFGVRRVPTFIYLVNGHEVRRRSGHMSQGSLRRMFRSSWL